MSTIATATATLLTAAVITAVSEKSMAASVATICSTRLFTIFCESVPACSADLSWVAN